MANAHETVILSALAAGIPVDMDPRSAQSGLLAAWLRGAQSLRDAGRPVSAASLAEWGNPGPLPPPPLPAVLEDSVAACEEAALERRVRGTLESGSRGFRFIDEVLSAATASLGRARGRSFRDVLADEQEALGAGVSRARFVPTGVTSVDAVLGGVPRGVVTVLGARPGLGKSASALALTDGATSAGHGAHIFSLEDPAWRYAHRYLARKTGCPVGRLGPGVAGAKVKVPANWLIDDTVGHSAKSICRAARAVAKTNDTRLVVVDYVQLLRPDGNGVPDHTKLQDAMADFTALARDLDAAVVAVSQLNRNTEGRDRPSMADLKASGAIEEVAKMIILIARPDQEGEDSTIEWIVAKNNFGKCQTIPLNWDGATCRVW